ncbi:MAG: PEP-utilizing enzyme [Ilumatobacter sp.]|jgi:rifampicin phosphotransferase|uniref:PEP-utilizing enzyme n=1 Tax=Ilumatobacter sp. TaxID=1967498 RepID=UPI00391D6B84
MTGWITDTPASTRFPVYTRSNASDVLPDPISPLGATLSWVPGVIEGWRDGNVDNGAFEMSELTSEGINPTCGFFNGFFYVNASVVRVFGERSGAGADGVDAAFFGNRPDTPPYVAHPDDVNEAAGERVVQKVGWVLSTSSYPELDAHRDQALQLRADRPDLSSLSDTELVEYARSLAGLVRVNFNDHVITSSNTAIGPTILGQIVPDLMLRLIAGAGDVDSAGPSHAMWALSRLERGSAEYEERFTEFLENYGCRGPNEWDPYSDSWETKPQLAHALIDSMRQAPAEQSPAARYARVVVDREEATKEALERVKGDAEATGTIIAAQASALRFNSWRERSKTNCVRVINEQRVAMRELGRRHLDEPRDVFMLLDAELDQFVADPDSMLETIATRKVAWQQLWTLEPPYFVESDKGIPDLVDLHAKSSVSADVASSGGVLTGAAGCVGVVEGRARVINDPSDPSALEPGDILVAPNTDPSWTPLFIAAGGVVVGVGAMNSHAVIVSREMGIPCVVSVTDCTKRIPDGAIVRVDGAAGTVTIL